MITGLRYRTESEGLLSPGVKAGAIIAWFEKYRVK